MFKCGTNWHKRYLGSIKRSKDNEGNPIIHGKVMVNGYCVYSMAFSEEELGLQMDELIELLESEVYVSKTITICDTDFFLN